MKNDSTELPQTRTPQAPQDAAMSNSAPRNGAVPSAGQEPQRPGTLGRNPAGDRGPDGLLSEDFRIEAPAVTLPKGGGAISGMGEKFAANPVTGTASMSLPMPLTAGRGGVTPSVGLSYDSGGGNGPFGLGWRLSLPSIRRKTDKGLPRYLDEGERADTYVLSDAEDLVPLLEESGGSWSAPTTRTETYDSATWDITLYRPRIEGGFSLIERWKRQSDGYIWWRTISRGNLHRVYGRTSQARVTDPDNGSRVFEWLLEEESDCIGNVISYQYKEEDRAGVSAHPAEQHRATTGSKVAYQHLKRVSYGNTVMGNNPDAGLSSGYYDPGTDTFGDTTKNAGRFLFHLVFDYGGHDTDDPALTPAGDWTARQDPFSSYRPGFDIRCYRLCKRILMMHSFTELRADSGNPVPVVVRSLELTHTERPTTTTLASAQLKGWEWNGVDDYVTETLPSASYTYSEPVIDETVRLVSGIDDLPGGLDMRQWRWVDLDGEGLSGLLTEQGGSLYYKRNEGEGSLAPARKLSRQPALSINGPGVRLVDLDGDGNLDVMVMRPGLSGFMARSDEQNDDWESFRPFKRTPAHTPDDPNVRLIDLDGDGHADILVTEEEALTWYPSEARDGFSASFRRPQARNEEKGPRLVFSHQSEQIFLADMSGDGLTDLVRIRNGRVDYWPNRGYGRFGARVQMKAAPRFDKSDLFDPSRIRLADIDGSGPTDLIYIGRNGAQLYFNEAGNGFSAVTTLNRFPSTATPNDIQIADIEGNGTACLVWSSPLMREGLSPLRYIRLMTTDGPDEDSALVASKPWLMTRMSNGLGRTTTLSYTPSTAFYIADRRAGKPWATRLPFPVQCLSRVESYDAITGWRFVNRYAYHHGYFDGPEREFRGFGMVEQWDTEAFSDYDGPDHEDPGNSEDDSIGRLTPVRVRTWFHTGAWRKQGRLESAYADEYFSGDSDALSLPAPSLPSGLSPDEEKAAMRSLRGQMLRQEVYAEDSSGELATLYTVTEQTFSVQQLQPAQGSHPASFNMVEGQTLSFTYDVDLDSSGAPVSTPDPRVSQSMSLEVDEYGTVLRSAVVSFRRRVPVGDTTDSTLDAEQKVTRVIVSENGIVHQDTSVSSDNIWRLGVPLQSRVWEFVGDVAPSTSSDSLTDDTALADPSTLNSTFEGFSSSVIFSYEDDTSAASSYRRLLGHQAMIYWNDAVSAANVFGTVGKRALLRQKYALVYTSDLIDDLYGSSSPLVTNTMLSDAGYVGQIKHGAGSTDGIDPVSDDVLGSVTSGTAADEDYWWIPSGYTLLDTTAFYQPTDHLDPFRNTASSTDRTTLTWDTHDLMIEKVESPEVNGTRLAVTVNTLDYRVMAPSKITDPNGTESTAEFDALGRVTKTAVRHTGASEGDDTDDHSAEFAYNTSSLPASVHTKLLKTYGGSDWQESYAYSDGGGNVVQTKVQAAPGDAPKRDGSGALVFDMGVLQWENADPRWVGSGRVIVDNKGNVVKQYEPFFSKNSDYEDEDEVVEWGVSAVMQYDPIGRNTQVTLPDDNVRSWTYTPWKVEAFDEEDNNSGGDHEATPSVTHLDAQGRVYKGWEFLDSSAYAASYPSHPDHNSSLSTDPEHSDHEDNLLRTKIGLDILGNPLTVTDALDHIVQKQEFDILGRPAFTGSSDEGFDMALDKFHASNTDGKNWVFAAVDGQALRLWRSGSLTVRREYDVLRRPSQVWADDGGGGGEDLKELMIYGELTGANPSGSFHLGQLVRVYDGAGLVEMEYDFKGRMTQQTRTILDDPSVEPDWDDLHTDTSIANLDAATASNQLSGSSDDVFEMEIDYDALDRPTEKRLPDVTGHGRSKIAYTYDEGSRLKKVTTTSGSGGTATDTVESITYNARGQREQIDYGNDTTTTYTYHATRFWLKELETTLSGGSDNPLQKLTYVHDEVGNILSITDAADKDNFFNNTVVSANQTFTYDAKYRLKTATGRENNAYVNSYIDYSTPSALPFAAVTSSPPSPDQPRNYEQRYTYDHAGNITEMKHLSNSTTQWTRSYTYAYDDTSPADNNQLRETSETISGSAATHSYTHNARGAMTAMGHLDTITRDWRDQIAHVKVDSAGNKEAYYRYDAGGIRVTKWVETTGADDVLVVYLGDFEIHREINSSSVVQEERETVHVLDDQARVLMIETETITGGTTVTSPQERYRYQYGNHLGSASLECDENGDIITYEEFHPYGTTSWWAEKSTIQVSRKRYRYTGMEKDEETGLSYHNARYYVTWLGRWERPDPIGLGDGFNRFEYTKGKPTLSTDRSGNEERPSSSTPLWEHVRNGEKLPSTIGKTEEYHRRASINDSSMFSTFERDPSLPPTTIDDVVQLPTYYDRENNYFVTNKYVLLADGSEFIDQHWVFYPEQNEDLILRIQMATDSGLIGEELLEWSSSSTTMFAPIPSLMAKNIPDSLTEEVLSAMAGKRVEGQVSMKPETSLIHFTNDEGFAGISNSGYLRASAGIFALPSTALSRSALSHRLLTGITPQYTKHVFTLPLEANRHFYKAYPLGPYSTVKFLGDVHFAPPGKLYLKSGELIQTGSVLRPFAEVYAPDALIYGTIASMAGGSYYIRNYMLRNQE